MTGQTPQPPASKRLLLIEDDDVDAMIFERAVRRHGLTLTIQRATDGLEALQMLRDANDTSPFDLCFLDLNLPRVDGFGFLQMLRSDPALASTPVFVLTTSDAPGDIAAAHRHNVVAYLVKQVVDDQLDGCMKLLQAFLDHALLPTRSGGNAR